MEELTNRLQSQSRVLSAASTLRHLQNSATASATSSGMSVETAQRLIGQDMDQLRDDINRDLDRMERQLQEALDNRAGPHSGPIFAPDSVDYLTPTATKQLRDIERRYSPLGRATSGLTVEETRRAIERDMSGLRGEFLGDLDRMVAVLGDRETITGFDLIPLLFAVPMILLNPVVALPLMLLRPFKLLGKLFD